jgi:hypothetical protein
MSYRRALASIVRAEQAGVGKLKEAAEKVRKNIFGPRMNTDEHG